MCLESCFECQEPCWPRDDLLPAVSPPIADFSCHGQRGKYGLHDHQPVDAKSRDHEKLARREIDMATLPGEMPGSSPSFQYEKPWYVVGD